MKATEPRSALRLHLLFGVVAVVFPLIGTPGDAFASGNHGIDTPSEQAFCLEHACFPRSVPVGNDIVELRNAAPLKFLGATVYSAALYTPAEAADVLSNVEKRLDIHYHRKISSRLIVKGAERTLRRNPDVDLAAIRARLDEIYAAFDDVADGDVYTLTYTPGFGSSLALNGEVQCRIEGDDFARAFFGIWLSDHALSPKLRDRLLLPSDRS